MESASLMRSPMLVVLAIICAACATGPSSARTETGATSNPRTESRTLVAAIRVEPNSLASVPLQQAGIARYLSARMFNAEIANLDAAGKAVPYLVDRLPQLNTNDWKVSADGHMETTYELKLNLTWHDGAPFTAEDFAFAWRAYTTPALGLANIQPFNAMEDVNAVDGRTVVVRWRRPYPEAGVLSGRNQFAPLPRHLLETALPEVEAFSNHPYWTREFIGLGPYRVEHWEPGTFIDAVAFDSHVVGRPKIARIKMQFMPDANTALASMLSGEVHLSADTSLRLEQATTLKKEWGPSGVGTILEHPNQWRAVIVQLRPELVTPRGLLDSRVRKALAHAIDRDGISGALYAGEAIFSDWVVSPASDWGPAVDRSLRRYPFDLRRAQQLMAEAGYARGPDGAFANATEGRFVVESMGDASADNVAENSIVSSQWREAGLDVKEAVLSIVLTQDGESRASFAGLYTQNTSNAISAATALVTSGIPKAENRWSGQNRGGWSNPEYDRLTAAFNTTLDRQERERQVADMALIFTEEVPFISLFFRTQPWAFVKGLTGLQVVAPESNMSWNIHEWDFR